MQLPAYSDVEKETELDAARAAVAANTNLFMELNEEEFAKYLQTFVQDVWVLLTKVTLDVRQVRNTRHPSSKKFPAPHINRYYSGLSRRILCYCVDELGARWAVESANNCVYLAAGQMRCTIGFHLEPRLVWLRNC